MLETTLDRMVRKSVEETLNAMPDAEADETDGAERYERGGDRKAYRAVHYERDLTVKAGKMSLMVIGSSSTVSSDQNYSWCLPALALTISCTDPRS